MGDAKALEIVNKHLDEAVASLEKLWERVKKKLPDTKKASLDKSPKQENASNEGFFGRKKKVDLPTKKADEFELLHSEGDITKSSSYEKIKKLSDEDLIDSVMNPLNGEFIQVNTKTGRVAQGNTRLYEIQRRGLNVDVPYE